MNEDNLNKLIDLLKYNNLIISVVESCTGGLLSHQFTKYPGSSDFFIGGIIAYNKSVKINVLGLDKNIPVVSKECSEQLVIGLKNIIDSDIQISVTGYAGPGAEPIEMLGTIYYSILYKNKIVTTKKIFNHSSRYLNCISIINCIIDDLIKII